MLSDIFSCRRRRVLAFAIYFFATTIVSDANGYSFQRSPRRATSRKNDATASDEYSEKTHLIFPGGGIFLNWQGGVISYLREQGYDLSTCTFSGSSAGSMTATLAATGVDFYNATDMALELAAKYNVWKRPEGLKGVLSQMIEEWLDELLPTSVELPDGKLSVLVTPVPFLWEKTKISSFHGRSDLIECNIASIYLVSTVLHISFS